MNSHHELAQRKGIQGERRLRLSVDKVHQSTGKRTSVRAAWHSVCKASWFFSCWHCRYVSWKIVIEHNYVVLWVKFNISCWFYSNRRTEDISLQTFLFSLQFVSPPALYCWWRLPHLTTCHIWKHKTHRCKTNISLVKWQKVGLCCFSLVQSAGHLVLLSVWGGFLSFQSSPHRDVGFIQGVGPRDSWWQELKIMLILYGTVNPPLRLRCRCQVYLRCVLAVSPQHQARCKRKKKKKECRRATMSLLLSILQFSLCSFFLLEVSSPPLPIPTLLCVSSAVPSKQNHATLSDLICSSLLLFLLFPKLQQWHLGVSIDGVFRYIGWSDINSHAGSTQHAVWECYFLEFVSRN